ncbi:MAG: cupin domain-containing protein [Alphaproteobacteria bacterium]|nr:cupin domain-containing protein [Alphaproteobacteria bacterium]
MTIHHHVSDDLLLAYAAGSLAEGWSLAVATHLALCPHCRNRVRAAERIGGEMLEALAPDAPVDTSWALVRARLEAARPAETSERVQPAVGATGRDAAVLPEPLRRYAGGDADSLRWQPLGRGAYQILLPIGDGETRARLLRIPAGKPVPEHGHGGRELTLVLRGSFRDGNQLFARGDLQDADASLTHQPIATPLEDCICLAVTDAPLRFRKWIVRLIQPVLGI